MGNTMITSDMIKKAGFIQLSSRMFNFSGVNESYSFSFSDSEGLVIQGDRSNPIRTVEEWQEAHLALTGEDLTF